MKNISVLLVESSEQILTFATTSLATSFAYVLTEIIVWRRSQWLFPDSMSHMEEGESAADSLCVIYKAMTDFTDTEV